MAEEEEGRMVSSSSSLRALEFYMAAGAHCRVVVFSGGVD